MEIEISKAMKVEKVMDRQKIADSIHAILDFGTEALAKPKIGQDDFNKVKLIRNLGPAINAAVAMVQQETAMVRANLIAERMKQLGYGEAKQLN